MDQIGLKLVDGFVQFLSERHPIKLVERRFVKPVHKLGCGLCALVRNRCPPMPSTTRMMLRIAAVLLNTRNGLTASRSAADSPTKCSNSRHPMIYVTCIVAAARETDVSLARK